MKNLLTSQQKIQILDLAWGLHTKLFIPLDKSYKLYYRALKDPSYNGPRPKVTVAPKWFVDGLQARKHSQQEEPISKNRYEELQYQINELKIEVANLRAAIQNNKPVHNPFSGVADTSQTTSNPIKMRIAVCNLLKHQFGILEQKVPSNIEIVRVENHKGVDRLGSNIDYIIFPISHGSHANEKQARLQYKDKVIRVPTISINQIAQRINSLYNQERAKRLGLGG